jgi:tetratricopeptide (TPR) repeat protein
LATVKLVPAVLLLAAACGTTRPAPRHPYGVTPAVSPTAYEHYIRGRMAAEQGDHQLAVVEMRMAAAAAGDDVELRVAVGEQLLAAGQLEAALAEAAATTEAWPFEPDGWRLLGRARAAQTDVRGAVRALARAVELDGEDEATALMLAGAQRQLGDERAAIATLRELVRRVPSAEGQFRLGRALAEHQPEAAAVHLARAVALDGTHIEARVLLAEVHRRAGRMAEATATLRAAFDRSGADASVGERLFHVLLEIGDRAAAADLLRALDAEWRPVNVRLRVALFFLQLRLADDALRIAQQLLERDAGEHAARVVAARAMAQLGRRADAVAVLREVPEGAHAHVEATGLAAELLAQGGAPHEGLALVNRALKQLPDEPALVAAAAALLEQLGAPDKARALLDGALARTPGDEVLVYARASLEERLGQPERAIAVMRRLLERDADSVMALNFIGYSYADRDVELDASERMLKRALELRPDDAYVLDSVGWLHLKRGRVAEARASLERAGRLAPFEPEILFHLGELWLRHGDDGRARDLFRQALALEPPDRTRVRLEERLRTLEAKAP